MEENKLGEKASVYEAPRLAATPPSHPSCPPPSTSSCPDLPVLNSKLPSKRAAVIVKNVNASVNIAHLSKWKKLMKKVRATLGRPDEEDKTGQDAQGKTTDRSFRLLLKAMRENFPDTVSTPPKIRGPRKKGRQNKSGRLSPWSRDQEDRNRETCQPESEKTKTGLELFTQQELALLDSDPEEDKRQTESMSEQEVDKLLESDNDRTPSPPSCPESPDYGPQEISEDEEYYENRHGRLPIRGLVKIDTEKMKLPVKTEFPFYKTPSLKVTLVKEYKVKPKQEYVEGEEERTYPCYDLTGDDSPRQAKEEIDPIPEKTWVLPPNFSAIIRDSVQKLIGTQTDNLYKSTVHELIEKNLYARRAQKLLEKQKTEELTVEETVELNAYWGFLLAYRIARLNQTEASRLVLQAETFNEIKTLQEQNDCTNCGEQHVLGWRCKPINSNSPQPIESFCDSGKNQGYIMGLNRLIVQPPNLTAYANVSKNPGEALDYPVKESGLNEEEIRGSNLYKLIAKRTEKIQKTRGLFIIEYVESPSVTAGTKCLIFHMACFLQIVKEATRISGLSVVVALVPSDYLPGMPLTSYRTIKASFWRYVYAGLILGTALGVPVWSMLLYGFPYFPPTTENNHLIDPTHNLVTGSFFQKPIYTLSGQRTIKYYTRVKAKISRLCKLVHHYSK